MGKGSKHHQKGTYSEDSIDQVSAPIDNAYQKKLLEINKQNISETQKSIKKNQELIRYCGELNQALEEMKSKTNSTHTQTRDKIQ